MREVRVPVPPPPDRSEQCRGTIRPTSAPQRTVSPAQHHALLPGYSVDTTWHAFAVGSRYNALEKCTTIGRSQKKLGCVRVRVHALNVTQCHPFVDARFATCGRAFTLPSARISAWHRDRKSAERAHFKCRRRRGAPRRRIEAESIDQRVTACSALLGRARKWALVVGLQKPFQSGRVKRKMGQLSKIKRVAPLAVVCANRTDGHTAAATQSARRRRFTYDMRCNFRRHLIAAQTFRGLGFLR